MKYPFVVVLFVTVCLLPAWASSPGQPLDCSDWVILEPGISCSTIIPYPCPLPSPQCYTSSQTNIDNEGTAFYIAETLLGDGACSDCGHCIFRRELSRITPQGDITLIAYVDERCNGLDEVDQAQNVGVGFDPYSGSLYVFFQNISKGAYPAAWQKLGLDGFATVFDVLQTFTPTADAIGFRVPYMPDGFPAADWFNSYYGDLATVGDWSQAQPLQCSYPASMPTVGDYLTVVDPLPDPAPGTGRYYFTSVNYQGQIRYGRKAAGGVLSGRDPAVLPACSP